MNEETHIMQTAGTTPARAPEDALKENGNLSLCIKGKSLSVCIVV